MIRRGKLSRELLIRWYYLFFHLFDRNIFTFIHEFVNFYEKTKFMRELSLGELSINELSVGRIIPGQIVHGKNVLAPSERPASLGIRGTN